MRLHRTYITNISVFVVSHFGQLIGCIVVRSVGAAVEFCGTHDDFGTSGLAKLDLTVKHHLHLKD